MLAVGRRLLDNDDTMTNRLKYDLVPAQSAGHRLTVTVPQPVWQKLESDSFQADNLATLSANRTNAIALESDSAGYVLSVNDKRIGASQPPRRDKLAKGVCLLLTALDVCANDAQKDPRFEALLGTRPINNTGRYSLHLKVDWPKAGDAAVSELVTQQMQATALKLKYAPKNHVSHLVYGQAQRDRGVTLETNPVGSCSVGTDGMWYRPEAPVLDLDAHNIYSHTQQLIIVVGGVALARADTLLAGQ